MRRWLPADETATDDRDAIEFDASAIDDVRSLDADGRLVAEVVATFLRDGHRLLNTIVDARQHADASGLARAAHDLSSSAGMVGARALMRQCRSIEHRARVERSLCSDADVFALQAAFERARVRVPQAAQNDQVAAT
jgi:HPt (histidine-containing phosphotransfer) domain-containing protein